MKEFGFQLIRCNQSRTRAAVVVKHRHKKRQSSQAHRASRYCAEGPNSAASQLAAFLYAERKILKKPKSKSDATPAAHLQQIFDSGHLGKFWEKREEPYRTFGDLIFEGAACLTFSAAVKSLHKKNPSVAETISEEDFTEAIVSKLRPCYDESVQINFSEVWKSILEGLLNAPSAPYEVMRDIYGIKLKEADRILELGPFKIYCVQAHQSLLAKKSAPHGDSFWGEPAPEYLIGIEVIARDAKRAYELADILFERFERMLKFLTGRSDDQLEAGIINYKGPRRHRSYAFREGTAGASFKNAGPLQALTLDDEFFRHHDLVRFWNLIVTKGTELEQRLILAAEWIGQSYSERSLPSSFLKAAIALETLFTIQESALITSSILSSLSESLAMLLGETSTERLQVERQVKKLYSMRSSIAHSGSADVHKTDVLTIQAIARAAVLRIFTYEEFNQLQTMKQLFDLIKMNKYAGPPLRAASN